MQYVQFKTFICKTLIDTLHIVQFDYAQGKWPISRGCAHYTLHLNEWFDLSGEFKNKCAQSNTFVFKHVLMPKTMQKRKSCGCAL